MFNADVKLDIFSVVKGKTSLYNKVKDRKRSSFYYRLSGSVIYSIGHERILLEEDNFIFIPAHSNYVLQSVEQGEYISLHFSNPDFADIPLRKFVLPSHFSMRSLFCEMFKLWTSGRDANIFACYSLAYHLISVLASYEDDSYVPKSKYNIIAPSINYLEEHLMDNKLCITSLGEFSGISYIYFYKIFKQIFKISPAEYIKKKRIAYAKSLIETGEFSTISQVASYTGYSDALYFSRLFKKETGMSPKEYKTMYL